MKICENNHDPVCFDEDPRYGVPTNECPVCALEKIRDEQISDLETRIRELEREIVELKADNL